MEEYPDRIKIIYIRDVTDKRDPDIEKTVSDLKDKVPVVVFKNIEQVERDSKIRSLIAT